MALLFMDGFDHVDDGYELLKWSGYYSAAAITYGSGYGRTGGWGAYIGNSSSYWISKSLSSTKSTIIIGTAVKISSYSDAIQTFMFLEGGLNQVELRFKSDGSIHLYRGGTTDIASSSGGIISLNTWYYLEVKITFSNTVGTIDVKVGGVSKISETSLDTSQSGNEYIDSIRVYANGGFVYLDDLYICDTSGAQNNDFLGDVTIKTLYPTSDGTHTDFTPSTGSDHYALVDEAQLTGETDYNESGTISHKDSYGVTTFSESGDIKGVQVTAAVKNADTGSLIVRTFARSGAVPADNEGVPGGSISQTLQGVSHIFEKEPEDDVAWTAAKVNAAEFGLKIQG